MKEKKILIIEDDEDVRKDLEIILTEEGFQVQSAKNGKCGIDLAHSHKPDLIISDIMMPEITGYDVLAALSKDKNTQAIPFIFLTAKVEKEDIRKGMQLGADDYIFKPFTIDDILNAIKTRLKRIETLKIQGQISNEVQPASKYTEDDKLFIKVRGKVQLVKVSDIVFIQSENQYTSLNLTDEKSILIRKSISNWQKLLPETKFIRIHHSTLINMEYIVKIEKWYNGAYLIHLKNYKEPFIASKRYSAKLRKDII